AALHGRLRRDLLLTGWTKTRAREVILQAVRAVFGDLPKGFAQLFVGELTTFGKQFGKVFEDALNGFDVLRIAIDSQALTAAVDLHVEQRLEVLNVLVVNAEKRFQAPWWKLDLLQLTVLSLGCMRVRLRVVWRKNFSA